MRSATVSMLKRRNQRPLQVAPRDGSKLRALYDLLQQNRGRVISITPYLSYGETSLGQLTDFYGLDIRRVRNGKWLLAGEWFGKVYVDYVAERLEAE